MIERFDRVDPVAAARSTSARRARALGRAARVGYLTALALAATGMHAVGQAATAQAPQEAQQGLAKPAIAMHGEPAMGPDFTAMGYVNPSAPKGGRITHGVLGTFDSLNPFVVKGLAAPQIRGYVIESLLARGYDEPFTLYGLLARTVE